MLELSCIYETKTDLYFSCSVLNLVKFIVLKLFEQYIYSNTWALQTWLISISKKNNIPKKKQLRKTF